jgi:uncharacterized protein YwlG (UPF0340 family)
MDQIYQQTKAAIEELVEKAKVKPGNIVVVGCPTCPKLIGGIRVAYDDEML